MSRDLSWGANCEGCDTRLNAGRAQATAAECGDGPFLCGSCRDEEKHAELRDAAKAYIEIATYHQRNLHAVWMGEVVRDLDETTVGERVCRERLEALL